MKDFERRVTDALRIARRRGGWDELRALDTRDRPLLHQRRRRGRRRMTLREWWAERERRDRVD